MIATRTNRIGSKIECTDEKDAASERRRIIQDKTVQGSAANHGASTESGLQRASQDREIVRFIMEDELTRVTSTSAETTMAVIKHMNTTVPAPSCPQAGYEANPNVDVFLLIGVARDTALAWRRTRSGAALWKWSSCMSTQGHSGVG